MYRIGIPKHRSSRRHSTNTIIVFNGIILSLLFPPQMIMIDPKCCRIIRQIALPTTSPTSLVWGGANLNTLFVTSSRCGYNMDDTSVNPSEGAVLEINGLGAKGIPMKKLNLSQKLVSRMTNGCASLLI